MGYRHQSLISFNFKTDTWVLYTVGYRVMSAPRWRFRWHRNHWLEFRCGDKTVFIVAKKRLRHHDFIGDDLYRMICRVIGGDVSLGNGKRGQCTWRYGGFYIEGEFVGDIHQSLEFIRRLYQQVDLEIPTLRCQTYQQLDYFSYHVDLTRSTRRVANIWYCSLPSEGTVSVTPGQLTFSGNDYVETIPVTFDDPIVTILSSHYGQSRMLWHIFTQFTRALRLEPCHPYVLVGSREKL